MSNIRTLNHDSVNPYNGTIPSNHVMVLRPNSQIDLRQELGRRLKAYYFGIPLLTFTLVFVILTIFLTGAILSIFGISQWKFTLTLQWLGLTMFQCK
ncbi:hypothetical protein AX774_g3050 [Zancudomyces culisetae]|uniref:Uncharacterized protein n=1 Tax=Zancudomyces culisetae TaxID=1213189 RepID=A0A1R1PR75_ZANCU|nr:hypothetical protein AX774_g3050 [Zancudomyces culisetae]|eukprot:OMH83464.1 hypothetical protein AX774_g3050 [Zancudomyces culisetae]